MGLFSSDDSMINPILFVLCYVPYADRLLYSLYTGILQMVANTFLNHEFHEIIICFAWKANSKNQRLEFSESLGWLHKYYVLSE